MRKIHYISFVLMIALSLIVTACGSFQKGTKVQIGEVTRSIFYAPQYIAITQGFFEEEGLDVELRTTPGGDVTMTNLLSDSIDVALVGSETSIYVYQQGTTDPVINFAQVTQTDGTFLVSREPVEAFEWEMLKGSVFLGQRVGGMPQMAGEFAMKKNGIDPHADLGELIQNVDFANIASAFASGTGQFVQLFEPTATVFEMEGRGYVVASFGIESGNLPYTVFMAKQSYIDKNKETIQKFTNAVYKAQLWLQQQEAHVVAEALAPFFEDVDLNIIESVVERYRDQQSFALDPIVDEDEWNNLLDIIEEAGEIEQRVPHSTLVNNDFALQAIENITLNE